MNAEEQKFTQLVKENKSTIYTVCFMFSDDKAQVDDLFQEVLINLWKGFAGFKAESAQSTWVWKVALNTCISADRKDKRRKNTEPLKVDIDLYQDTDSDTRQVRALHNRINKLQPFDRAIVLLWLENLSYDDIGAIVGISAKNVSVRLVRIKEELKKMTIND
ncbi:MAG: sigma-70 family RNA polymerase sigma factor [Bacteroidales bacterium]|nr:sigma-70 family RNA polymerase sigma factor [Bacteroidales bacterium]